MKTPAIVWGLRFAAWIVVGFGILIAFGESLDADILSRPVNNSLFLTGVAIAAIGGLASWWLSEGSCRKRRLKKRRKQVEEHCFKLTVREAMSIPDSELYPNRPLHV